MGLQFSTLYPLKNGTVFIWFAKCTYDFEVKPEKALLTFNLRENSHEVIRIFP